MEIEVDDAESLKLFLRLTVKSSRNSTSV